MDPELVHFHVIITQCKQPEDLFGNLFLDPAKNLKLQFHRFAKIAHADRYRRLDEQRLAHVTFAKLNDLHQQAIAKIEAGLYGTTANAPKKSLTPPVIKSAKGTYVVTNGLTVGDVSTVYCGEFDSKQVIIKIASASGNNTFLTTEASVLKKLNEASAGTASYRFFIPTLLDSFQVRNPDPRQVNIFEAVNGFRSLTEIHEIFPDGLDQRHFVWIFNRLLTVLAFAHSQKTLHGAVVPDHIFVHPSTHAIQLIDWCFAVPRNSRINTLVTKWRDLYPPEVLAKTPADSAADVYMAAQCMKYLLGGDAYKKTAHPRFRRLLESCWIANPARRQQSAWDLFKDFQILAEDVLGPRRYVKLELS